jgi:nucleotide-binding universal stress UspA family protein
MLRLLIAVDGSEHADRAIDAAVALARHGCAVQVSLLNVREWPVPAMGEVLASSYDALDQALRQAQDRLIATAEQRAIAGGLTLLPSRKQAGFASDEILREAAQWQPTQIVMGTRGLGALRSLFMGSVAQRVVHGAQVPVLLVK